MILKDSWQQALHTLDFAFQPIVNMHTGALYGVEALLRRHEQAGFASIQDVFDQAFADGCLYALDLALRAKVLDMYKAAPFRGEAKLFYNLDNRVLSVPEYSPGNTRRLIDERSLSTSDLCFEVSERHEIASFAAPSRILEGYKRQDYCIAIDDFGSGYSGLQLLYHAEPDMIKIDRFFIADINDDSKKKFFVTNVVNMAHIMGIAVIAEGVENEREFFACKEIGCDFVQGHLVQRPVDDPAEIQSCYAEIEELGRRNRRLHETPQDRVERCLDRPETLPSTVNMLDVLELFRRHRAARFFPVLNEAGEPLGLVRERDLKHYVYSPFGISMLKHWSVKNDLAHFLHKAPVVEIHSRLEKILEVSAVDRDAEAVIVTENGRYRGVLDSKAILQLIHEREIAEARDQNPLTRLPGNIVINELIADHARDIGMDHCIAYFDFDNFKPFNDLYGFRQGDRIILLFADILRNLCQPPEWFVGHIGGDDFFLSPRRADIGLEAVVEKARAAQRKFAADVTSFYPPQVRRDGFITARCRGGESARFPLLEASAAVVFLGAHRRRPDDLGAFIAEAKQRAKTDAERLCVVSLPDYRWPEGARRSEAEYCMAELPGMGLSRVT